MSGDLDKFIASQAKLTTLSKQQGKSINLLNLKYKALNTVLGPFYRLSVDIQNKFDTAKDLYDITAKKIEKLSKVTKKMGDAFGVVLKYFKMLNTIMLFVLGGFALIGVALVVLTKQFGGGEGALSALNMVFEAGKKVIGEFMGVVEAIGAAISGLNFGDVAGSIIPMLEGVFAFLGNILTLYLTLIGAILGGIGDVITRMAEAGMFQRIVDAFGTFFGLVGMAFGIIKNAIDDTGVTMGDLISFVEDLIGGIVDFLFDSGIIEFAVKVIEYIAFIGGVIAVLAGKIISIYIQVWAKLAPPLIRFVSAVFAFLEPIARIVLGILGLIMDGIMALISWLLPYFEIAMDGLMVLLEPILWVIEKILDGVGSALEFGGGLIGGAADFLGFNDGGIATGPKSGYPVTLHGTEAVVPLPDGRTIPVSIKGDMSKGTTQNNNVSINISGSGNAKEIAKVVSDEVSKVLRNRSRGGNFTRGI